MGILACAHPSTPPPTPEFQLRGWILEVTETCWEEDLQTFFGGEAGTGGAGLAGMPLAFHMGRTLTSLFY